ncbi:hypothetical protein AYO38_06995 [bacterium SCGC AG-212-C10]|nr:hypothetical protein AYO38_06995 [bacterium SCGC AG-212-C10]
MATNADIAPVLTWQEIEARHQGEWVVIADPQTDSNLKLLAGRVVYHGTSRSGAWTADRELGLFHTAVRFVGRMPSGAAFLL